MLEKMYYVYLGYEERRIMLESLIDMKNSLHAQGWYTDCIDEILLKVIEPKKRKVKIS